MMISNRPCPVTQRVSPVLTIPGDSITYCDQWTGDGDAEFRDAINDLDPINLMDYVAEWLADEVSGAPPQEPGALDPVAVASCVCGCTQPYTPPGTRAFYQLHLDHPLWAIPDPRYPGEYIQKCKYTLREFAHALMGHIMKYGPRRDELESAMRLHCATLPDNHVCPSSLYMLTTLCGAPSWKDFEQHACTSGQCTGHLYGKPACDGTDLKDVCPKCAVPRYNISKLGGK